MTVGFLASMLNPDLTVFVEKDKYEPLMSTAAKLLENESVVTDWHFLGNRGVVIKAKGVKA